MNMSKLERQLFNQVCNRGDCLAKNVQILTDRGEVLPGQVSIGDQLIGRDGRRMLVRDVLVGQEQWMLRITTSGGSSVTLSADHPVAARGAHSKPDARPAREIQASDYIYLWDASRQDVRVEQVEQVERVEYQDSVYNFILDPSDFLVANGILVGDWTMQ